jgi:histidinol-phosphate aminotransferase
MFTNPNLINITRRKVVRTNTSSGFRLDMAERLSNYDARVFEEFVSMLTVEDLITYPSDDLEREVMGKIASINEINPDNVMIDSGSDSVIKNIFQAFGDPSKKILVMSPSFPMYEIYARGLGIGVVEYKLTSNISLNLEDIAINNILDDVSIVVIANPGSPFGSFETCDAISSFADILKHKGIRLLLDEAYVDFSLGGYQNLIDKYDNIFIARTFSKGWGAAGCRVGYCLSTRLNITEINKVRLTYPISNVSLKFINYLLNNQHLVKDYCAKTVQERNDLVEKLGYLGYAVIPSENNSVHIGGDQLKINKIKLIFEKYNVAFKDLDEINITINFKDCQNLKWIRISVGEGILDSIYMQELFSGSP